MLTITTTTRVCSCTSMARTFFTRIRARFSIISRSLPNGAGMEHRVLASVDGQLLPIPINLDTINKLYGLSLTSFQVEEFFASVAEKRDSIRTSEDVVVSKVGRELYEKFFRGYTRKQWALDPSELDAQVTARVPTRTNRDDRYFSDSYQSMPLHGFTRMFENMLDHPNIKLMLNTDYREVRDFIPYSEMIYTGPIDEYFDFRFGKLPYRCLEFKHETHDPAGFSTGGSGQLPERLRIYALYRIQVSDWAGTRQNERRVRVSAGGGAIRTIRFPRPENSVLYKRYQELAEQTPGVYFVGAPCFLSLLQHGSGCRCGVNAVQEDRR